MALLTNIKLDSLLKVLDNKKCGLLLHIFIYMKNNFYTIINGHCIYYQA